VTDVNGKLHYQSYLLRLWSSGGPSEKNWKASLEDPHTGERLGFASLERLFAFLQKQTGGITGDGDVKSCKGHD
jgi:hypothetical protein